MGLPILDEIVNITRTGFETFVQTIPKPLLPIIFLFFLVTFGSLLQTFFLNGAYECVTDNNNEVFLVEKSEFNSCAEQWANGYNYKYNLTDVLVNGSIQGDKFLNETRDAAITGFAQGVFNPFGLTTFLTTNPFSNLILSIGVLDENVTVERVALAAVNPRLLSCEKLYVCLTNESREELGLTRFCSVDDIPEYTEYYDATTNKLSQGSAFETSPEGINLFSVQCSSIDNPPRPVHTFLGVEYLSLKLWILLFMVAGAIVGMYKWKQYVKG